MEQRSVELVRRLERAMARTGRRREDLVQAMAQAAGITPSTVNQILRNEIDMPPDARLSGFARVLGVSLAHLQGRTQRRWRNA